MTVAVGLAQPAGRGAMGTAQEAREFLDELKPRQVPWLAYPAVLGFLATCSERGVHASVATARVDRLSPGEAPTDVRVELRGALPRPVRAGECVTVSISRYDRYSGFQIKTGTLRAPGEAAALVEEGPARLVVHGRRTYTTHHSPYELQFYEHVPYDELQATVGGVDHAVLAVGPDANISPRLLFHHEVDQGCVATYHGDGVAMKTYHNLAGNSCAVMMVFDLSTLRGWALLGRCEEVPRDQNPRATEQIDAGFKALGFGRPNRIFRHLCNRLEPIAVTTPGT
jgi:hypothetical protein